MKNKKQVFYALYRQWGNSLLLWGEVSLVEQKPSSKDKNFVILASSDRKALSIELSRDRTILVKAGIVILADNILPNLWYENLNKVKKEEMTNGR